MTQETKKGEWGVAVPIAEDLIRIRLKNTLGSMMVNSYLHISSDDVVLVDPGWPWTLDLMETALREIGLDGLNSVSHFLYTHTHIDHMGAAAILGKMTDANHLAPARAESHFKAWHAYQDHCNDWLPWIREAFATQSIIDKFESEKRDRTKKGWTMSDRFGAAEVVNYELLSYGDEFVVGDLRLQTFDAKGHGPYHLAFFEPDQGYLFSGDVILATPTPISRTMDDDLEDYLESLDRLEKLNVSTLLPGHGGHRVGTFQESVERSRKYMTSLMTGTRAALNETPQTLVQVTKRTFEGLDQMAPQQWIVSVALVDSALQICVADEFAHCSSGPRYQLR